MVHVRPSPAPSQRSCRLALAAALLAGPLALPLGAQLLPDLTPSRSQTPEPVEKPGERAEAELLELCVELDAASARLRAASTDNAAPLAEEVQLLEGLQSSLRQQVATAQLIEAEAVAARDIQEQLRLFDTLGPSQAPPYGYLFLESVRDRLRDQEQRAERLRESVTLARDAAARTREAYEARERSRRRTKEAASASADPSATSQRLARRAELESRAAHEELLLRQLELDRDQAALAAQELRRRFARAELEAVAPVAELTEEDRLRLQTDLAQREVRVKTDAEAARRALEYAMGRWLDTRRRLEQAGGSNQVLQAEVEAHQVEQTRRRIELDTLEEQRSYVACMRDIWERRLSIFLGQEDRSTLRGWCAAAEKDLAALEQEEDRASALMGDVRRDIVTLDALIDATASSEIVRWLRQSRTAKAALVEIYQGQLTALEEMRRLHEKLIEDGGQARAGFELTDWLGTFRQSLARLWNHEFFFVQDSPITPGKLVWGLAILLFGGLVSKRVTGVFGQYVLPRFGLNEGARNAFESLFFYMLVVTLALFALRMVNIPLTAFTILGGALAIGFGFGSQNVVKNFISGLIILAEQPVRVGDLIQIGELYGTVQHIGLRSTRLRTGENVEIIVPNSNFLEQNVVNWTLTDTKTRIHVAVGFVYGSNTRDVKEVLKLAVSEHGLVLKSPEPVVIFKNFGESSLEFEVHFWIHMQRLMDKKTLESDIRFRIESLCREAGLMIAFPQRDVHLSTSSPIEVRLAPAEAASGPIAVVR